MNIYLHKETAGAETKNMERLRE